MSLTLKALFLLVFVIATLSVFGQKKQMQITTTELVQASPEAVYDLLRSFERFPEWSPFVVTDPGQKNYVTGTDGSVGSIFHWEGDAEKSLGSQTLVTLKEGAYLRMECQLEEPFSGTSIFEYHLTNTKDGVEVRQVFSMPCSGFSGFMMRVFGVQKEIATTNALGLERLRELAETEAQMAIR